VSHKGDPPFARRGGSRGIDGGLIIKTANC
jgi:hypothetical protein